MRHVHRSVAPKSNAAADAARCAGVGGAFCAFAAASRRGTARRARRHAIRRARSLAVTGAACVVAVVLAAPVARAAHSLVRVPLKGPAQLREMRARGIEVVAVTRHGVDVVADDRALAWLRTRPWPATVLDRDDVPRAPSALGPDLGLYHTYAEMESVLTALEAAHPAIARLSVIGTSIEGRNIYALKISDHVAVDEGEPEVALMGNLHARELMAVEMPLGMAEYLLGNYGVDTTVTRLVDTREIWILPMLNPDGHVYVENNHSGAWWTWWRLNRRDNGDGTFGVDLNRNFGFQWGYDDVGSSPVPGSQTYRGTGPFSEPETQAIRAFVDSRQFTLWLSYHSYGELLLYPWGYTYTFTPDHEVFQALGDTLTAANGYLPGNPATGAIYITNGDSDDWGYGDTTNRGAVFAFTPEVNTSADGGFGPPDTLIAPTFQKNLAMNLLAIEYADRPGRVVGPKPPVLLSITNPWGNAVHRLTWTGGAPSDPNPPVSWDVELCTDPAWQTDDGSLASAWTLAGFTVTGSGFSGPGYYSGSGDNLNRTMTIDAPFLVDAAHDTLTFMADWDIETDWDYAYVEISTDQGLTWQTIPGNVTTNANPNGNNLGNGITGTSGGWTPAVFPLDAWLGQEILVRIAYVTDAAVTNPGIWIDDVAPVPTCASVSLAATAVTDTTLDVTPDAVGWRRYRVRARDAEGQIGRWSHSMDVQVTSVTAADVPGRFHTAIGRNRPNPFNPSTTLPFVVGGRPGSPPRRVVLEIFDVRGARVTTLVDARRAPGVGSATWNGRDARGRPVASGVYFARLRVAGDAPALRRLVLLK